VRPLISVPELAASTERYRICDLRWDLTDPAKGKASYEAGHIPGAVFVDLDEDLAGPPGLGGRHPLPTPTAFAATLGRLGVDPATSVVAYDDVGGRIAARLWWMLRAIGHDQAQVLDGGYQAWVEEGEAIGHGNVTPEPAHYPPPTAFSGVAGNDDLTGRTLIDARSPDRYRGDHEPVDPKAGHIPGAHNVPTSENLDEGGRFRDPGTIGDLYSRFPDDVVVSCGSGVTACHDALAMVVAGRSMPDVYVGSFSEWSRLDLPVVTGDRP
jgi:thiosulfate/3-mercaptopyruvate sulfurtransferase